MSDLSTFQKKVAERRAAEAATKSAATPPPVASEFADMVPEPEFKRSVEDEALDAAVRTIDILVAYTKWCGKMTPEARSGQTEGIKISCPIPGHADSHPSAWINTDKQTWYCAKCSQGGDAHDIAAFHFGYPVPGYKEGARFHDLRRDMAKSMGYTFIKPPGAKAPIAVAPSAPVETVPDSSEPSNPEAGDPPGEKADDEPLASVTELYVEDDYEPPVFPVLDWEAVVTPGSFLDKYMQCCKIDDVPEEYHFFNGLLALGMAIGRDVTLFDSVPVYGNLFICMLGNTGDGKSRSFSHLSRLLKEALPPDWANPFDKGAHVFSAPASAEALITHFSKPVEDPTNPKVIAYYAPVRGLVEFNELSQLVGRGQRMGNVLKPTLMQFYDSVIEISSSSLTTGKKMASEPFGSCFTTTQPKALKDLISASDAGSGFLNRWVFASGRAKQKVAVGGARVDVTPAVMPLKEIQGWAGLGKEITWSEPALMRFTEIFHNTIRPDQMKDETEFLSRMDLLYKKLILLLCANEKQSEVTIEIVNRVFSMYGYLLETYGIPAGELGNTVYYQIMEEVRKVVGRLEGKHPGGVTLRDIMQRLRKKFPPPLVTKMIEHMVTIGELELTMSQGARGPATARYRHVS